MISIHLASAALGNLEWEPPEGVQAVLLSLDPTARAAVIAMLEGLVGMFVHSLSGTVLAGEYAEGQMRRLADAIATSARAALAEMGAS